MFDKLTELTRLWIHNNQLTELPGGVFDSLTSLTTLYLHNNQLTELPGGVFDSLTSLTTLYLHNNQLTELPGGVFDSLTSLTTLYLHNNQLTELPGGVFDSLTSLTTLALSNNQLTELPGGVFDSLTSLTTLYLGNNQLTELPDNVFDSLTSLTALYLSNNKLESLPVGVFDSLTSLTALNLYNNQLTELPGGVFDSLTSLTALNLYNNQLTELPGGVFDSLTSLTALNLYNNQLTELPGGVFDSLTSLTTLNLYNNQLTELPGGVFDTLRLLTTLYLNNNQLTELPDHVFNALTSLTTLALSDNQLTELPGGVFDTLTKLTTLYLHNNQLTELPVGVFDKLESLTTLYLHNNQLTKPPGGVFNYPGLTIFWLDPQSFAMIWDSTNAPDGRIWEGTNTDSNVKIAELSSTRLGDDEIIYEVSDEENFEIDGNILYLREGVALDYDTKSSYEVTVIVKTDDGDTATERLQAQGTLVVFMNDSPVARNDMASVREGGTTIIDVKANDTDVDRDSLTVSAVTNPSHGTATVINTGNDAGKISYKHNGGEENSDSFTYTVSDGRGGTATATVRITIIPVNDEAIIGGDLTGTVTEDVASTSGALTVSDPDNGNTFRAQKNASGNYGTFSINADGGWTYTLDNTNAAVQSLKAGAPLTDEFTVQSVDGTTATVTITIMRVNDAPTGVNVAWDSTNAPSGEIAENTVIPSGGLKIAELEAIDIDAADAHSFTVDDTTNFEVKNNTELYLKQGVALDHETKSSYAFTLTATDSGGLSASSEQTLMVTRVAPPPPTTPPAPSTTDTELEEIEDKLEEKLGGEEIPMDMEIKEEEIEIQILTGDSEEERAETFVKVIEAIKEVEAEEEGSSAKVTIILSGGDTYYKFASAYKSSVASSNAGVMGENALPEIEDGVTIRIKGNGAIIERDSILGCDETTSIEDKFRLFSVLEGGILSIEDATIRGGCVEGGGGGILSRGTLELKDVTLSGNEASEEGGAIKNVEGGVVKILSSTTITENIAESGGGIYNEEGSSIDIVEGTDTRIADNEGGNCEGFDSASCESESDGEDEVTEGGGGGCGIAGGAGGNWGWITVPLI